MNMDYSECLFIKHFIAARIQTMCLDKVKGLHINVYMHDDNIKFFVRFDGTVYKFSIGFQATPFDNWYDYSKKFFVSSTIYHIIKVLCSNATFNQKYGDILLGSRIPSDLLTGIFFRIRHANKPLSFMIKNNLFIEPITEDWSILNYIRWQKVTIEMDKVSLSTDRYNSSLTIN